MFPERLAGGIARNLLDSHLNPDQRILEIVKLLMANLFHIIRVCNTKEAWDLVCLGSDFDGLIGAFQEYNELDDYDTLAQHFFQFLNLMPEDSYSGKTDEYPAFTRSEYKRLMFGYTPEQIVDKIMYKNVENFLEKYFTDDYLLQRTI
jgi:microsomal dipeptidase-like Zn-dependent dipeptidase